MFNPSVNNIFKLINYFATFNCSVLISKNDGERRVNGKSLIGIRSLDLHTYDIITLYFGDNVNIKDIKGYLNLIE